MIERTYDTPLVQKILSHPTLLRRSGSKTEMVFDPELQRDLYYLLAIEGEEILGLIVFHQQNPGCYQGHVNYRPMYWGHKLEKYTKEAIEWMFVNTDCEKIFAFVPDRYPEVKKHSIAAGMKVEGTLEQSYRVGEKVYSQSLMGISKK